MVVPMVIDLTPDSSDDGGRPEVTTADASRTTGAHNSEDATALYRHTLELLAPLFPEIVQHCSARDADAVFPVTFRRSEADWIQLVFPYVSTSPAAARSARASLQPLEKELVCANMSASGCRSCRFAKLLRGLLVLKDKDVFDIEAVYVVHFVRSDSDNNISATDSERHKPPYADPIATIRLQLELRNDAPTSLSLQDFDLVLAHLHPAAVTRASSRSDVLAQARESTCHVLGCTQHARDSETSSLPLKRTLNDVFESLMAPREIEQMAIRDDQTYVTRMAETERRVVVTDLPIAALQTVVRHLDARALAALSSVCSLFQHLAYEVVPGLNLVLYRHQRKALQFLLHREAPRRPSASSHHPFMFPPVHCTNATRSIDLVDRKILREPTPRTLECRGGLFCDEPGLGKTITMLALILRTKGQRARAPRTPPSDSVEPLGRLRSADARGRTVHASELVDSIASLIIVPSPLVSHWQVQIETHVEPRALAVYVDTGATLPSSEELAAYDVVITSLERLAREWRHNRPASALEARAPERYGFEGPARYVDGALRGEVSPLLRVRWVRVVVDEGHKLGGTAETNQMRMARIFVATKRWVMTGTPTPNTMHSADLRHMHGLLVFLQDLPFGDADGKAWLKAIARPFEQHAPSAFARLQRLLSRIMLRHTKSAIRDIIPDPVRHTVVIDPSPKEHDLYNAVASIARANLVATDYDPEHPGRLHLDSLLNPMNLKYAMQAVKNLQTASCGGSTMDILLENAARVETIADARSVGIVDEMLTQLIEYINRALEKGLCSPCQRCARQFKLLMLIPCGHLCCADCVDACMETVGAHCPACSAVFDIEVFQKLQPGFEFHVRGGGPMDDLTTAGNAPRARDREREVERREALLTWQLQRGVTPARTTTTTATATTAARSFRAIDYRRDFDVIDASKALYVVARVKELRREYAQRSARSDGTLAARHVKVIVFSQFTEHIWNLKVAFAQQGVETADFMTLVSAKQRMKNLHAFRTQASLSVLLLTEVGSHGLDLSFVTHVFLLEEVWDKSLEQQVVSRAHRMGARQAVVIEQLVMRGTIEALLLRMNDAELRRQTQRLEAARARELVLLQQQSAHGGTSGQRSSASLDGIFPSRKKQKRRLKARAGGTAAAAAFASSSGSSTSAAGEAKATRLQQQLYYVLQNLRLLDDDGVAEPGHVRYAVEDERGIVLRTGSRRMAAYTTSTGELVLMPPESAVAASTAATAPAPGAGAARPQTASSAASAAAAAVKSEEHHKPLPDASTLSVAAAVASVQPVALSTLSAPPRAKSKRRVHFADVPPVVRAASDDSPSVAAASPLRVSSSSPTAAPSLSVKSEPSQSVPAASEPPRRKHKHKHRHAESLEQRHRKKARKDVSDVERLERVLTQQVSAEPKTEAAAIATVKAERIESSNNSSASSRVETAATSASVSPSSRAPAALERVAMEEKAAAQQLASSHNASLVRPKTEPRAATTAPATPNAVKTEPTRGGGNGATTSSRAEPKTNTSGTAAAVARVKLEPSQRSATSSAAAALQLGSVTAPISLTDESEDGSESERACAASAAAKAVVCKREADSAALAFAVYTAESYGDDVQPHTAYDSSDTETESDSSFAPSDAMSD